MPSSSSTAIPTVSVDARIDAEGPRGAGIDAVDTSDACIDTEGPGDARIDTEGPGDARIATEGPLERVFPMWEELIEFVR